MDNHAQEQSGSDEQREQPGGGNRARADESAPAAGRAGIAAGGPAPRLVLASQSPARLRLLRDAGFLPETVVSEIDESAYDAATPHELALTLAHAKAQVVAKRVGPGALVIGCDSVLDLDGVAYGKPSGPEQAAERWRQMRGKSGMLVTGHCLIDTREPADGSPAANSVYIDAGVTLVRFSDVSDEEIDAYVATGEPLHVAGAFTLDGLGGSFVDSIAGDPSNVIGLSLPLLRRLLGEAGVRIQDLWAP
ncbi:MAG TPA: nucleoside triphosphate pyrophosphatase [Actinocrinis sp.]|nr:nucleoside triphosphate pyrophosphatase [Actinocrinis sp.]